MKYSIRGTLVMSDGSAVVDTINNYVLWRLFTGQTEESFTFEAWVNTVEDKTALFDELKPFVAESGDRIDWHECTHDESAPRPCVIAETYTKG